jgi:hypothetical protein
MHSRIQYILLFLLSLCGRAALGTPQWQWATALGAAPAAVATDALGNSYVIGSFQGTAQLGSTLLVGQALYPGDADAFIAKFRPNGTLLWATQFGGSFASVRPTALALDGAGNCYFTGTVRGTVSYGTGQTLNGVAEWPGVLVGRCSAGGQVSWLRRDGSSAYASLGGSSIVADKLGNCFVAGGVTTPLTGQVSNPLRYQFFLASYSPTGSLRWSDVGQSPTMFNNGQGLALDPQGHGYFSGYYTGQLTLAGTTLTYPGTTGFIGRFRQHDGTLSWLQNLGGGVSYLSTLTADARGLVLAGRYSGNGSLAGQSLPPAAGDDAFLARFHGSGQLSWLRALPATPGDDVPVAVRCDATGTSYVLLNQLDATRGSGSVQNNFTLATLSFFGSPGWTTTVTGAPQVAGHGCALDAQFRLYVAGSFDGSVQFGPHTLSSGPGFLARLGGGFPGNPALAALTAPPAVYPNPVTAGRCQVRVPGASPGQPTQLSLYDRFGQEVLRQQLTTAESTLATHALPPGPYVLRLSGAGHSSSQQLLVAP